jgi:phosphoenolpyruvate carboxylase
MSKPRAIEADDKDLPLRDDIRLLGRILGDTIREQGGDAVFDIVEKIRQSSVRFRRDEDTAARRDLEVTLNSLPPADAILIIRAFGFFSHLANIAEDRHHIRRTRAHVLGASAPREGTMAFALARTREAGVPPARLAGFFAGAMVVPVLTAHPTEVRRQSAIDREMEVAELLAERDGGLLTAAELRANEAALRRAVLILWQTSPLRRTRLRVIDEVANGLSYYDHTFLSELPRFYADLEEELAAAVLRRPRGGACGRGHSARGWAPVLSAHGQLDRRRPRRRSVCDRGDIARGAERAERPRAPTLPRRAA